MHVDLLKGARAVQDHPYTLSEAEKGDEIMPLPLQTENLRSSPADSCAVFPGAAVLEACVYTCGLFLKSKGLVRNQLYKSPVKKTLYTKIT